MIKILISIIIISLFKYLPNLIISLILITIIFINLSSYSLIINITIIYDILSYIIIILSIIRTLLIILSSQNPHLIHKTILPILLILTLTFRISSIINFYIIFELVLIPTIILIIISGKQIERLQARVYLIIYTLTASIPLLVRIIYINNPSFIISFTLIYKYRIPLLLIIAFIVKIPIFFTHLWLPKAHVEAPLEGSIILAAVLLKLGGYGLIRFIPLCLNKINNINIWLIRISLLGATATRINCIRQKDLKSLIAYSSVSHIALVLIGLFSINLIGLQGAIIIIIAHGLASSALFLLVNDIYIKFSTRNIISFKGITSTIPNISFWWFIFIAINISAPPSINIIGEIFLISSIINWNYLSIIIIFIISLVTASFSLIIFINISHNKNETIINTQTSIKIFSSLLIHLIPLIILIFKIDIIVYFISSLLKTIICGIIESKYT